MEFLLQNNPAPALTSAHSTELIKLCSLDLITGRESSCKPLGTGFPGRGWGGKAEESSTLISSTEKLNKHTRKIQNRPSVTGQPVPCDDAELQATASRTLSPPPPPMVQHQLYHRFSLSLGFSKKPDGIRGKSMGVGDLIPSHVGPDQRE
ncbi:cytochrome c-type heme lyase-like [Platysternon megacephalum]|uniref:Cytochrome c-type heme lyase-like n=1 Tax=Platysternon megacephalum TaxID=55544 RepID=A0A4D9EJ87_9SAUR|nr:cytochrome c-type heme lyase-like [Platysternon megacephalum]